jgi:hypothetical protein
LSNTGLEFTRFRAALRIHGPFKISTNPTDEMRVWTEASEPEFTASEAAKSLDMKINHDIDMDSANSNTIGPPTKVFKPDRKSEAAMAVISAPSSNEVDFGLTEQRSQPVQESSEAECFLTWPPIAKKPSSCSTLLMVSDKNADPPLEEPRLQNGPVIMDLNISQNPDGSSGITRLVYSKGRKVAVLAEAYALMFAPDTKGILFATRDRRQRLGFCELAKSSKPQSGYMCQIESTYAERIHYDFLGWLPDGQQFVSRLTSSMVLLSKYKKVPRSMKRGYWWEPTFFAGSMNFPISSANSVVRGFALSSNGTWVATISSGLAIRLFDAESGHCSTEIPANGVDGSTVWNRWKTYRSTLSLVAFSPDNQVLASNQGDPAIRLWAVPTGEKKLQLLSCLEHEETQFKPLVHFLSFSPDNTHLAAGLATSEISIWNWQTSMLVGLIKTSEIFSLKFSPHGWLASGHHNVALIWDAVERRLVQVLDGGAGFVCSIAFSSDGKQLALGADYSIQMWEEK